MRAGRLNRRIQIQSYTETQDSLGEITQAWSTTATVWAAIEPLNGREYLEARAINEETRVRFRIRYRSGLDSDMRIVDPLTSLVYDIESIIHDQHGKREIVIMATQTNDETSS